MWKSDESFSTSIDFIFHFRFITPDDLTGSPFLKPFPLSLSTMFRWITGQCCVPYSPFTVVIIRFWEIKISVNRQNANWLNVLNKKTFTWINLKVGQIYVLHSWWLLWERWKERTGEELQPRQDSKADNDQNGSSFQAPLGPLSQAATSSLQSTRTSELLCHPSWKTSWLFFHPFWNFLKFWRCCSSNNLNI